MTIEKEFHFTLANNVDELFYARAFHFATSRGGVVFFIVASANGCARRMTHAGFAVRMSRWMVDGLAIAMLSSVFWLVSRAGDERSALGSFRERIVERIDTNDFWNDWLCAL